MIMTNSGANRGRDFAVKRRDFLGTAAVGMLVAVLAKFPYMEKKFALVYVTKTKEPRRLIDTSNDVDDSFLLQARAVLAPDETMEAFMIKDFPVRYPRYVLNHIGRGVIL